MGLGALIYLAGAFNSLRDGQGLVFQRRLARHAAAAPWCAGHEEHPGYRWRHSILRTNCDLAHIRRRLRDRARRCPLNFSGSILAWGLLIPLLNCTWAACSSEFMPELIPDDSAHHGHQRLALYRQAHRGRRNAHRKHLHTLQNAQSPGWRSGPRIFHELETGAAPAATTARTERYMSSRIVLLGIFIVFALMIVLYSYLAHGALAANRSRHRHARCRLHVSPRSPAIS